MTKPEKKQTKYYVTTFYKFFNWPAQKSVEEHSQDLELWCQKQDIKGLIVTSKEGFNGTVASDKNLDGFKEHIQSFSDGSIVFKDSESFGAHPFRRMKVKLREEIVTLGDTSINPLHEKPQGVKHMSPQDWQKHLDQNPHVQMVDVRNDFEAKMGSFRQAQNWGMEKFTEFPELVKKSDFKKDQPVLMFCTGGIRCEKASIEMSKQGYKEVYQLDGGILNYLKDYPDQHFDGECFVFDHRVAVDQNLKQSKDFCLCIHCGQPAKKNEFDCVQCGTKSYGVCEVCWAKSEDYHTCSKNCTHHHSLGHKTTKPHQDSKRIKYKN